MGLVLLRAWRRTSRLPGVLASQCIFASGRAERLRMWSALSGGRSFFFLDLANPETTPALAYGAKDVPNLQQTRKAKRPDYRPRFCTPSGKFFAPFRIACVSVAVFFSLASCRIEEKSVGCLRLSVAERFAGLVCLVSLGTVHRISRSPLSCSHLRGFPIGATHLCFLLRTSIQSR